MALDKNGYAKSVMNTEPGICYLCGGEGDTVRHECFFGSQNRRMSKKKGAWVNICPQCHRIVHEKPDNGRLDRQLKRDCQSVIIDRLNEEGHDGREIFYAWFRRWYD